MPLSPDRQPLVPPALKRMKKDHSLKYNEGRVTPRACCTNSLIDADEAQCDRSSSETSASEACGANDLCCPWESPRGHQVIGRILLDQSTPVKSPRQARSTVAGLISQFSQLSSRRPVFDRLSIAVGSLLGRMCSRRRAMMLSPEEEDEGLENQSVDVKLVQDGTHANTAGIDSTYQTTAPVEDDFLQQTSFEESFGESCVDNVTDDFQLDRAYLNIDFDIDLDSGEESEEVEFEYDKRNRKKSRDSCKRIGHSAETEGHSVARNPPSPPCARLKSISSHRPRKRWTFLSPLNLLPIPQSSLAKIQKKLGDGASKEARPKTYEEDNMAELDPEKISPPLNTDLDVRFSRRLSKNSSIEKSDSVCALAGSTGAASPHL